MTWYSARQKLYPTESLTRVSDLTRKMVGTATDRKLKTKGAETYGVLLFLLDITMKAVNMIGPQGQVFLDAGACLARLVEIWSQNGVRLPEAAINECFYVYSKYCSLTQYMDDLFQPKRHLL